MARSSAALAAVLFLMRPAFAGPEELTGSSLWASSPVRVDGSAEEWGGDARISPAKTAVSLAFRNDRRNLYILMEFRTPVALGTIGRTGLTVYRTLPEGGKRLGGTRLSARTASADRFVELLERQGRRLDDRDKVEIRMRPSYPVFEALAVNGRGKVLDEPSLPPGEDPPGFKVAETGGVVVYEIRLPFGAWAPRRGLPNPAPGEALGLEFAWGGLDFDDMTSLPNGEPGAPLMNVIMPNASPATARADDPLYKKHTVRISVDLAAVPAERPGPVDSLRAPAI